MKPISLVLMGCMLLATVPASAQPGISIRSSVEKNRVLLGEPFHLTIETVYPAGVTPVMIGIDSLPHFERQGRPVNDTQRTNELTRIRSVYTYASFDSGHWVIPGFALAEGIHSDTLPMDVVFSEFDPAQPYHDIKDIIEVPPPAQKNNWWWYAAGGLLLGMAALYFFLRRKKRPAAVAAPESVMLDPYEEAKRQLAALAAGRPPAKEFHSRLIDILRWYVYRRRGILSLQKTSDDLVRQLGQQGMNQAQLRYLGDALQTGDMVKFAKYVSTPEEDQVSFKIITSFIDYTEQVSQPVTSKGNA